MTEQEYRQDSGISQSFLTNLINNRMGQRQVTDSMLLGSLVDCMLTEPDEVNDRFQVIEAKAGDKPKQIVDHIINAGFRQDIAEIDRAYMYGLFDLYEYRTNYADQMDVRRLLKFYQDSGDYYNMRVAYGHKHIISQELYDNAERIANKFKEGRYTKPFFELDVTVYNQMKIFFEINGVPVKSMLDRVLVNEGKDIIIHGKNNAFVFPEKSILPIDFKVISGKFSLRKFRYDIQGSFYSKALKSWMLDNRLEDYELLPMHFFVYQEPECLIYRLSETDSMIGEYGAIKTIDHNGLSYVPATNTIPMHIIDSRLDLPILGWRQALYMYRWYMENNEDYHNPIEHILNDGILDTNEY